VQGSLDLLRAIARLSERLTGDLGVPLEARVAAHKGVVFLDRAQGDLYGFAVNVAARLEALAEPGTLVVSDEVRARLGDHYVLDSHPPRAVKGVAEPLSSHTVHAHRPRRGAASPAWGAPLVGRDQELAVVLEAWRAAAAGTRPRGTCVAVVGEGGIGKSRLVGELQMEAAVDGATVIELGGASLQSGAGLWPLRQLLEERAGLGGPADEPDRLRRLRAAATDAGLDDRGVALLATLVGIDPTAGYEPVQSDDRRLREEIEEAVLTFLRSGFGERGTIVVVEDLHWIDPASRDLIGRLIREDHPNTLFVLTSRDLAAVPRGDLTTVVPLAPLEEAARLDLVRALGGDDLDLRTARQVAERSDGIPLFAGELLRAARLDPDRPGDIDVAFAIAGMDAADHRVPEVLYEPLTARLNVAPHALEVASVAATIGRDVDRGLLERACSLPRLQLYDGVQALLDGGVLEPHGTRPDHLRFHHELVRSVVEDLQPPQRRRQLHRQVADAMLAREADNEGVDRFVLATHLQAAGDLTAAADAYLGASAAARKRGDLLEARAVLSRAVEMVTAPGVELPVQEVALRLRRGYLSISLEGNTSAQAMADYDRCLELVAAGDDADGLVSTLTCIAAYCMAKGELDRCAELYLPMGQVTGPLSDVARYLAKTGEALATFYRGDFRRALALGDEALAMNAAFDREDSYDAWYFVPLDPRASNHGTVALARFLMGDVSGWDAQARSSRATANAVPFPTGAFTLAGLIAFEVWMHSELGLLDAIPGLVDEIEEISSRHGFDQWSIVAATQRELFTALVAVREGSDPETIARYGHTLGGYLAMWKTMDQWVFLTYYTTFQGILFAAAGERELARAAFEESLAISERTGMGFYDAETLRHLAAVTDDPLERVATLRAAIARAQEQGGAFFELRAAADLHRETGDSQPLREAVERFPESASYEALDLARALVADRT
jgi:tetratricopeptide (TPR) repeat protein